MRSWKSARPPEMATLGMDSQDRMDLIIGLDVAG
jgi:hypothetical protein